MGTVKYTGPVASFHCPTEATIRSLKVHFSPKQLGEGTPSPENVREIVGWDGVEVYQTGCNIWDEEWEIGTFNTSTGTNAISPSQIRAKNYIKLLPNTTYYVTYNAFGAMWGMFFDIDKKVITDYSFTTTRSANVFGLSNKAFTTPSNCYYMRFYLTAAYGTTYNKNFMISYGSTVTPYEPYHDSITNYEFGALGKNKYNYQLCNIIDLKAKDSNGNEVDATSNRYDATYTSVKPATAYTISGLQGSSNAGYKRVYFYTRDKQWIQRSDYSTTSQLSFTTPNDCYYIQIQGAKNETYENIQLEYGSTATTYEAYKDTVYGGWVDLVSGEVCEEYDCITVDDTCSIDAPNLNGNEPWKHRWSIRKWNYNTSKWFFKNNTNILYCDRLSKVSSATKNGEIYGVTVEARVYLYDDEITTTEEFHAKYDGMELCAPVAEPYNTYQIAPTSLQTFLAQNNVWSNADYVEVEYDLHETQTILERKQFIVANQPHIEQASGAIASFTTDLAAPLKGCRVEFKPVQDLNGYSKPWPAGGGKNLFDKDAAEIGKWLNVSTGAIESTNTNYALSDYIPVKSGLPYVFTYPQSSRVWFYDVEKNPVEIIVSNPYTPSQDGFVLLTIGIANVDINTIQFEQGTTLSAYSPYSNICPISGWTGFEVEQRNKNLLGNYENGYFRTFIPAETQLVASTDIPASGNNQVRFYRIDKTEIDYWTLTETYMDTRRKRYFTPHEDCYYWKFNNNNLNVQLEFAPTFTAYEPYQGTTSPIDWTTEAGTIYGGYVDLVSGEVWADTRVLTIDSTTSFYVGTKQDGTNKYFYIEDRRTENQCKYQSGQLGQAKSSELFSHGVIGNSWSTATNDAYTAWVFSTSTMTTIRFAVPASEGVTTVALMQDWIAEHGALQISYPLATPILITTLTSTALRTLRGTNNIWSNANGNIELAYWKH